MAAALPRLVLRIEAQCASTLCATRKIANRLLDRRFELGLDPAPWPIEVEIVGKFGAGGRMASALRASSFGLKR